MRRTSSGVERSSPSESSQALTGRTRMLERGDHEARTGCSSASRLRRLSIEPSGSGRPRCDQPHQARDVGLDAGTVTSGRRTTTPSSDEPLQTRHSACSAAELRAAVRIPGAGASSARNGCWSFVSPLTLMLLRSTSRRTPQAAACSGESRRALFVHAHELRLVATAHDVHVRRRVHDVRDLAAARRPSLCRARPRPPRRSRRPAALEPVPAAACARRRSRPATRGKVRHQCRPTKPVAPVTTTRRPAAELSRHGAGPRAAFTGKRANSCA